MLVDHSISENEYCNYSEGISYKHKALGSRVAKLIDGQVVEKYLWLNKTTLLATYDRDDNLVQRFEYTLGNTPTSYTQDGTKYYIVNDHLGSPRAITDGSGAILKAIDYDSFGNLVSDTNPQMQIPFGFAGDLYDADTNLIRFGYRDYDPEIGRWTVRDPIGFAGGDTNLYGYVLNDPMNWIDPTGLIVVDSTPAAVRHYVMGDGSPVTWGPNTQNAIKNSSDQQYRSDRITSGQTSSMEGVYGVNVEGQVYHVGDTPVHYSTVCNGSTCTTTYTSKGDGF
jgi:RHS repeat-associated protein